VLSTALIVFREVLEASLIIGILLTATQGVNERKRWIGFGIAAGFMGACVVAVFADVIAAASEGMGQEIFNASVLMVAIVMLAWHNVWMTRHSRQLVEHMKTVGKEVESNNKPLYVLSVVVSLAVLREGSEVVLFTYGIAASGSNTLTMLTGGILGIAGGIAAGAALYFGLLRIPTRYLFSAIAWLIVLLAAGMASQASGFLIQAGLLPAIKPVLWDSSRILSDHSLLGEMLHTLIGYNDRPAAMQLLVYVTTVFIIGGMTLLANKSSKPKLANNSVFVTMALVAMLLALVAKPAGATHKVYYPNPEQDETEIEFRAHTTADTDKDQRNEQQYKLGVGHGFTSYWFTEVYVEAEKPAVENYYEFESIEWENLFQLTEQGKYWADWGVMVEYAKAVESDEPDELALTPIMQKQWGKTLFTINLPFERETGKNADDAWELGYAWQLKWLGNVEREYGIESYGMFGEVGTWGAAADQRHQMGPAIFGKLRSSGNVAWKYVVSLLVGLTPVTPDFTLGGTLEYEF